MGSAGLSGCASRRDIKDGALVKGRTTEVARVLLQAWRTLHLDSTDKERRDDHDAYSLASPPRSRLFRKINEGI